ncbi:MAG TPA: glycosyl hydrolase, partial [Thermomicrobiaceae bacterium]|nr:glycosyl hydrolase [Thermomicrobiaceae bacterium]
MAAAGASQPPVDPRLLESMEWRLIGPFRGGRVVAVAGHPTQPGTFYFGGCAGGVWKTTDGGTYWENITDGYFNTAAVGALAVSPSDPNVIYAGTGETAIRGNVSHGDGVYKSTDGGRSWQHLGLAATHAIGRVRIHPQNPDVVYVAALGHVWGPNKERGVYRSKDGGKTWEHILFKSDRAGAIDLTMDPNNPRVLYAAFWEAQRYPHALNSGGPDSAIYRSTDGGDTWQDITRNPGLPTGVLGKIGVAASPAKPGRVWALVEAEDGAMFRSDDGGDTWTRLSEQGELRRRAWYYTHVVADPSDADTVWVMNLKFWKSIDGGKSFQAVPTPHGDNHDLWIDPRDSNRMIEGNDGGACVTFNGGVTWSSLQNQPTAQFYHVTTDNRVPYRVFGSQQDNTAMSVPSASARGAITQTEWWEPGGGESGYIAVDPTNPEVMYGGSVGSGAGDGRLIRFNHATGETRIVTVWPEVTGMGRGAKHYKYRFQWTYPIHFSTHDPNTLHVASNHVHRSTDEGMSWEVVSPDLTRNEPSKLEDSGGPITLDNTGAEVYCTVFALAESPHERGVYWAGSDDGLIHLTRDNMQTWQNVTPPADMLPEWALISIIEPSPFDAGTAYVAATRYKHDDFRPYLLKTADYGQTWSTITDGIPANEFTRTVRADPNRKGLLYAGTETGVYVSFDDGGHWQRFQANLPVTPIHDLMVKGTDLIAATHGRSFWILDDLTPLHQVGAEQAGEAAHLYAPRPANRFKHYGRYGENLAPSRSYGRF